MKGGTSRPRPRVVLVVVSGGRWRDAVHGVGNGEHAALHVVLDDRALVAVEHRPQPCAVPGGRVGRRSLDTAYLCREGGDRKSGVTGKRGSVRVDRGGAGLFEKKKTN